MAIISPFRPRLPAILLNLLHRIEYHGPAPGIGVSQRQNRDGLFALTRRNRFHIFPEMLVEIRLVVRIGEFRDHAGAIVEHDEDDRALRSEDEAAGDLARRGGVEVPRRSDERRLGKEGVSTCKYRGAA